MKKPLTVQTERLFPERVERGLSRWFQIFSCSIAPGLDRRSLFLFRRALALLLLFDLALRSRGFFDFYIDNSMTPRTLSSGGTDRFSIYLSTGNTALVAALFIIQAMFAFALFRGIRARSVAVVCFILNISLQFRNEWILSGADVLIRLLLFWAILLPLDEKEVTPPEKTNGPIYRGPETFGYALLLFSLYAFAAIIKWKIPEWRNGEGVIYALWVEGFGSSVGTWFRSLDRRLLEVLNHATLVQEGLLSFLIWVSIRKKWGEKVRFSLVLFFLSFHASFLVFLDIGLFPYVGFVAWLPLLPPLFWSGLESLKNRGKFFSGLHRLEKNVDTGASPLAPRKRLVIETISVVFFIVCFYWNLAGSSLVTPFPKPVRSVVQLLAWDQHWNMFSSPIREVEWFVVPAAFSDGSVRNIFPGGPENHWQDKPKLVSDIYETDRHRKYYMALQNLKRDPERLEWGKYYCRNTEGLEAFRLIRYYLKIPENFDEFESKPLRMMLWSHQCSEGKTTQYEKDLDAAEESRK